MPLYAIPPDPVPTEQELAAYWPKRNFKDAECRARYKWQLAVEKIDPNAFHVKFPPEDYHTVYLRSPRWDGIRTTILLAYNYNCICCRRLTKTVHHRDYRPRVLSGDDLRPLVPICPRHHRMIHFDERGVARGYDATERILAELVEIGDEAASAYRLQLQRSG